MKAASILVAGLAIFALPGGAQAHPHTYVGLVGDLVLLCDPLGLGVDVGGVCFESGHAIPDTMGRVTFSVQDELLNPVSGRICVDENADSVCGGPGESFTPFCGSVTLVNVLGPFSGPVLIHLDGPINGNPLTSPCGGLSVALIGTASHD